VTEADKPSSDRQALHFLTPPYLCQTSLSVAVSFALETHVVELLLGRYRGIAGVFGSRGRARWVHWGDGG